MKRKLSLLFCGTLLGCLAPTLTVQAGVPHLVQYQGRLTDNMGVPLDTTVPLTFSIFTDSVPTTTALWTESFTAVEIHDGLFEVLLGSTNPLPSSVFNGSIRGLGIRIGSGPISDPLIPITSMAYAYRSLNADTADFSKTVADSSVTAAAIVNGTILFEDLNQNSAGHDQVIKWDDLSQTWYAADDLTGSDNSGWTDDGSKVRLTTVTDSLGVGTTVPTEKLEVIGNIRVNGKANLGSENSNAGAFAFVAGTNDTARGDFSTVSGGYLNTADSTYSTIGGGYSNTVGHSSTIGGGSNNNAPDSYGAIGGGLNNTVNENFATIAGGNSNEAHGLNSTVGGGQDNIAHTGGTVAGGYYNQALGNYSSVGGGFNNVADTLRGTIGGGSSNLAGHAYATVGGGQSNKVFGYGGTIAGGSNDTATGVYNTVGGGYGNATDGDNSVVGGGRRNEAKGNYSTVAGGFGNKASEYDCTVGGGRDNTAGWFKATVAGGRDNTAGGENSTVGGGEGNTAEWIGSVVCGGVNNNADAHYSVVSGGLNDTAAGAGSVVCGGIRNRAYGYRATVAGGEYNQCNGSYAFTGGGYQNQTIGSYSVILGGEKDTLTMNADYSMAFGNGIYLNNSYRVVFFDGINHGRFGINRDDRQLGISYPIHVGTTTSNGNGAYLSNGGTWTNGSSRGFKERFESLDGDNLLQKVMAMPIRAWCYKHTDERHIGPVAEDFVNAFDVGVIREQDGHREDHYLAASDVAGVALAGVQQLARENAELRDRIEELEALLVSLKVCLSDQENVSDKLARR